MTPEQAAQFFRSAGHRLETEASRAVRDSLDLIQEAARRQSEGTLTPAIQKQRGPFYSRRRGAKADPNVLNRWEGDFWRNWEIEQASETAGSVVNVDPRADDFTRGLVDGKPLMVERHPETAAAARAEPEVLSRVEQAIENALRL